jgi:hypothetical protein
MTTPTHSHKAWTNKGGHVIPTKQARRNIRIDSTNEGHDLRQNRPRRDSKTRLFLFAVFDIATQ